MKVVLGCDHGGFPLKSFIKQAILGAGHDVIDVGTNSLDSVDYPDITRKACIVLQSGDASRGIILCGSGVGASIAANKFKGIYASVCHDPYTAHQGVEHDNMNVLCMGARVVGPELAKEIVTAFLQANFLQDERFQRRFNKVKVIENEDPEVPGL